MRKLFVDNRTGGIVRRAPSRYTPPAGLLYLVVVDGESQGRVRGEVFFLAKNRVRQEYRPLEGAL